VRIAEVADEHAGTVQCLLVVLAVRGPVRRSRVCVPLTVRTEEDFSLRPHLIGTVDDLLLGRTFVYDGVADPVFVLALADAIRDARSSAHEGFVSQLAGDELPVVPPAPSAASAPATTQTGSPAGAVDAASDQSDPAAEAAGGSADPSDSGRAGLLDRAAQLTVRREEGLAGESRVEIDGPDGSYALTVLREIGAENPPAVRYPLALTARDSQSVHPVIGWSRTRWYDDGELATVVAPFAVLAHALPGSRRAWRSAVEKALDVDSGSVGSFSRQASVLGSTAGRLHLELASEFGTVRSEGDPTKRLVEKWRARVEWALRSAPGALAPFEDRLRAHAQELAELDSIGLLQRIHGELTLDHLTVGTAEGPRVIGFGVGRDEPRPVEIDLVALVRSVDYAAGYAWLQSHADSEEEQASLRGLATHGLEAQMREDYLGSPEHLWYRRTVNSLLSGYSHARGETAALTDPVLRAALLDRLLVETVTELRNRPAWLILPLAALAEMLGEDQTQDTPGEAGAGDAGDASLHVDPDEESDDERIASGADVLPRGARFDDARQRRAPVAVAGPDTEVDGAPGAEAADARPGADADDASGTEAADAQSGADAGDAPDTNAADVRSPHGESMYVEVSETEEPAETEVSETEASEDDELEEAEAEGPVTEVPEFVVAPPHPHADEEERSDKSAVEPVDADSDPTDDRVVQVPPKPAHGPSFGPVGGLVAQEATDAADLDEDGAGDDEADGGVTPRSARDSR
jgi:predicted trehalose synthase